MHERDEDPKCQTLKTNRDYVQENHGTTGNGELALKGSCVDSFTQGLSAKILIWKAPELYVKETHLLILKCLSERQKTFGTFPRNGDTGRCHICDLIYLVKVGEGGSHLGTRPLTCRDAGCGQLRILPTPHCNCGSQLGQPTALPTPLPQCSLMPLKAAMHYSQAGH